MVLKLSTLAIALGLLEAAFHIFGLINPVEFGKSLRRFPRSVPIGCLFMLAGTAWFMWNVSRESLSDFETIKPYLYTLFVGVGVGSCFFIQDFLAVRGLAVLMLLLGKLMVDIERWADTDWRWVIGGWAYVLVICGIWFTVSPWRLRDGIYWLTANEKRIRLGSATGLAFGIFVAMLGFKVF